MLNTKEANIGSAILDNYELAQNILETSEHSSNSAIKENEVFLDSINGKLEKLRATWESFSNDFLDSQLVKTGLDLFNGVLTVTGKIVDNLGLIPGILTTIFALMSAKADVNLFDGIINKDSKDGKKTLGSNIADILWRKQGTSGKILSNADAEIITQMNSDYAAGNIEDATEKYKNLSEAVKKTELVAEDGSTSFKRFGKTAYLAGTGLKGLATSAGAFMKSLGAAIPQMLAFMAVSTLITKGVELLIDSVPTAADKIEAMETAVSNYNDAVSQTKENIQTVSGLSDEFKKLAEGVNSAGDNIGLTADEYDRYHEIVDQIVDLYPELVQGYDAEGNAIVNRNSLIEDAISLQKDYQAAAKQSYMDSGQDIIDGAKENLKTNRKEIKKEVLNKVDSNGGEYIFRADTSAEFGLDYSKGNHELTASNMERILAQEETFLAGYKEFLKNQNLSQEEIQNAINDSKVWISKYSVLQNEQDEILQPIISWMKTTLADEGVLSQLPDEFAGILDGKLKEIAATGDDHLEMIASAEYAINALNAAAKNPEIKKYSEQIETLNKSVNDGTLSASEYESQAKSLKSAIDEYGDAAGRTDESLKELCSTMADSINLHYEDAVQSINEAFNPLVDTLEAAKNAKADFDAAMENTGDFNDGVKSFQEMLTEVYGEKDEETKKYNSENLLGKGSNAFWQAAEQTLGSERLEQLKYDFEAVNREVQKYYEQTTDGAKATNYLVDMLEQNMGKINAAIGENTVWISDDGTLGFDIEKTDFPELADILGMSEEALASLFENAKQFGDIHLFDPDEVKRAIEASESAFAGSQNTYMNYDTLLKESGMSNKEFYDAADYIETLDVKLLKATTDSKELAAALVDIDDSIGQKTEDGYKLNAERTIAQLSNMGFGADDITQMMSNLEKDNTITLDVTTDKELVQSQLDKFAEARELINSDISDDDLVNSLDNLKLSIDTLAVVLGDQMPSGLNIDAEKFDKISSSFDSTYGKTPFDILSKEDQDSLLAYNSKLRDTVSLMESMKMQGWSKDDIEKQYGIDDLDKVYDFYQKLSDYTGTPITLDLDDDKVETGVRSAEEKIDAFSQKYTNGEPVKLNVSTDEAMEKTEGFEKYIDKTVKKISDDKVEIEADNSGAVSAAEGTSRAINNTVNDAERKSVPIKGDNSDAISKISMMPTELEMANTVFKSNPLEIFGEDKTGGVFQNIWDGWRGLIKRIRNNPANGTINISGKGSVTVKSGNQWNSESDKQKRENYFNNWRSRTKLVSVKKNKSNSSGLNGNIDTNGYPGLSSGSSSGGGSGGGSDSSSEAATNRMDELLARLQTESGYTKKNRSRYTTALKNYKKAKKLTSEDYKKYLHEFYKLKSDKIIESYEFEQKGYAKSKSELKKFAKSGKLEWSEYYEYIDKLDEARVERAKKRLDDDLGRLQTESGNSEASRTRWWKDYNDKKKYLDASERKEYRQQYYDYRAGEYVNAVSEGRGSYQSALKILKGYVDKKRITWEQYYSHLDELEEASLTKVNNDISNLEQYISDQDLFGTWAKGESEVTVWKKALEDLRREFEAGTISSKAYAEATNDVYRRLKQAEADLYGEKLGYTQDLIDLVKDMIKQEKQDLIDALNEQLDKYNEIIEAKKKSLELTRKETEHQETLEDYIKQIAELQTQADMLALDDSREGKAKRTDVLEQIGDLQAELNKYQRDYGLDQTEEMLDDLDESYGKYIDEQTKAIEDSIKYEGDLIKLAMERIQNTNFDTLFKQLDDYNYKYGDGLLKTTEELKANVASAFSEGGWLSESGYLNTSLHLIIDQLTALQQTASIGTAGSKLGDFNTVSDYSNTKDVSPIISGMRENYNKIQDLKNAGYSSDSDEITRLVLENNLLMAKLQEVSATKTGTYSHLTAIAGDEGNFMVGLNNQGNKTKFTGKSIYDTISDEDAIDDSVGYARTPIAIFNAAKNYKPEKKGDPGWDELVALKNELKTIPGYENAMVSKLDSKGKVAQKYYKIKDKNTHKYYYHTGLQKGFVGDGASLKQNEVYRILTDDELVMNKNDQLRIGSQLEVLSRFMEAFDASKIGGNTSNIAYGNGEIKLQVNAPITIQGNVDSAVISELNKAGDRIADKALINLEEVLARSGYKVNASLNAFKK